MLCLPIMAGNQPGSSTQEQVANGDQQIAKAEKKQVAHQAEDIRSMLQAMAVQQQKEKAKDNYEFWETQPVAQFNEDPSTLPVCLSVCTSNLPTLLFELLSTVAVTLTCSKKTVP